MGGKVGQLGGGVIDQCVRTPYNLATMGRAPLHGGPQRVSPHVVPKAKLFSDEDEKTTIEADTQWADEPSTTVEQGDAKLGNNGLVTNVTSATGGDEYTVDDQNQNLISAVTPPSCAPARLVITAGNDTGVAQDLLAGKSYTIGRGLGNDLVLTDIAVSRKHFDLRNAEGSWVIVDRGSGNGTVVNGNLEDNPFMLANGDVIEIGTTTFRFDFLTAVMPSELSPSEMNGFGSDDEEMSTVAGKTLNAGKTMDIDSVDVHLDTPSRVQPVRPKTLPPPAIRPRTVSNQGVYSYVARQQPQGTPGPLPATTLPMPQMSNRVALQAPSLLAAEPLLNLAGMPGASTTPGHAGHNARPLAAQAMYGNGYPHQGGYPQAKEIPPHSVHAQMLVAAQLNKRGDHSTAHVQPAAYNALVAAPAQYTRPPLTKRAKMALIFGGLAAAALFTTIALVKSGGSSTKTATAPVATPKKATGSATAPRLTATPIEPPKPIAQPPHVTPPPKVTAKVETTVEKVEAPKPVAKIDAPQSPQPPQPQPKVAPRPPVQQTNARKTPVVKVERPDPPKQEAPRPKNVATAEAASDRAESLYKDRKFNDASNVLVSAAKSADASDARELRAKSQKIALFAKVFNTAMAPGSNAKDVFDQLQTATNYDQSLGGFFQADISARLQTIIGKAAVGFFSAGNYEKAHQVVVKADALGSGGDNNIKVVRQSLEAKAQQIYSEAIAEQSSNPSDAKDKLKQIKAMTDAKSSTNQKAMKALSGG